MSSHAVHFRFPACADHRETHSSPWGVIPGSRVGALFVVHCPEHCQPGRNGRVRAQVIAWCIPLDVEDWCAGPGVDAGYPERVPLAAQEPRRAYAEWIWPDAGSG